MRRLIAPLLLLTALAAPASDSIAVPRQFIPVFHGTFRAMFEQSVTDGSNRFRVRNARLSAGGAVLPVLDYYLQVDFCNAGKVTVLDAYARLKPVKGLQITAGQSRVPFGVGASRSPAQYYFLNRSTVAKYTGNIRSVGVKAAYAIPGTGVTVEGGVFNSTSSNTDQNRWNSRGLTYSVRANYRLPFGLMPQIAFMSRRPSTDAHAARFNMADASLTFSAGRWFAEAEFMWLHCTGNFRDSRQYNIMCSYAMPVRAGYFNRLSFQARWDGMTAGTDGIPGPDGILPVIYRGHNRITAGTTFSAFYKTLHLDLRVNYEQYLYGHYRGAPADINSKLSAGLIIYF